MLTRLVPMINTTDLGRVRAFYERYFGFRVTFDCPTYLGLTHEASGIELGFMIPCPEKPGSKAFSGEGVSFALRVDDVDAEYARLIKLGAEPQTKPEDMPWGDRMFLLRDPTGAALYLYRPGEPDEEYRKYVR